MLMALFQRFWRWLTVISRTKRLMMDVSSSVGEVVMLGAGSIEHRELVYYTIQKSTTFEPPRSGPRLGHGQPSNTAVEGEVSGLPWFVITIVRV